MVMDKYGNYVRKFMWQLDRMELTFFRRNGIKKIKCTHMKCHINVNSTPTTQLPHKFSYIVVIFIHNHFESPTSSSCFEVIYRNQGYTRNDFYKIIDCSYTVRSNKNGTEKALECLTIGAILF
jgi:hypothetical protein